MNKVLFLDIDGVLNSHKYEMKRTGSIPAISVDPSTIEVLNEILEVDPDIKVVISSSRVSNNSLNDIKDVLEGSRLIPGRIIDTVDVSLKKDKAIQLWIATHNPKFVCILDDEWLFTLDNPLQECLVKVSGFEGLKEKHIDVILSQFI